MSKVIAEPFNRKFGLMEIAYARNDWSFHRNAFKPEIPSIQNDLKGFRYFIKIVTPAYSDGYAVALDETIQGVYIRGNGIYPRVPNDVIRLADQFVSYMDGEKFANQIYDQVCKKKKGVMRSSLENRMLFIDIELNFVADMLREYNQKIKAKRLENEVQRFFPKFYHGSGFESRFCREINVHDRMIHY